ncbi:glycoside hydrolase family 3 N-terminal domain-containing protein [Microbacterium sp. Mu-80]|uniref:Glycoside hydrolase family 3 N-terminal domain-containing protein n=1 Tax=Microbacterium bandirmense TaxID=3122050 RepID=A0ABU8LBH0_9MICO
MTQADGLERLAGCVLWPGFLGHEVPSWLADALAEGLAGVVYFAQNLGGDTAALSAEIHRLNPQALIGIDEEGGSVTRLETETGSTVPGAAQLGVVDDLDATRATGYEIGRRVDSIGADVVIGPVADVNTDPRNPVIGVRAFGADTGLVSRHVAAAVQGVQSAGVAACAKHYPGHGDTHTDSHHDLPHIDLDEDEIRAVHLPPFVAATRAGVQAIMTAHITAAHWGDAPATLNPAVLGGLRASGFDGVIITDALDMAAIRETVGIGEGAVRALAAGADLLCIGNPTNPGPEMLPGQDEHDFLAARDAIVAALRSGDLPRQRVEDAARRVAAMADAVRARPGASHTTASEVSLDADAIADRAVRISGDPAPHDDGPTTVIDLRRPSSLAVDSAAAHVAVALAAGGEIVRLDAETASDAEITTARNTITATGAPAQCVILVDRADEGAPQRAVLDSIRAAIPADLAAHVAVVNVGMPADIDGPVVSSPAASPLAARAARRALQRPKPTPISTEEEQR